MQTVSGCHVWFTPKMLGPSPRVKVKPGTRVVLRPSCPMDIDLAQTAGPRLALGSPHLLRGTSRTILFRTRGVYRITATNVQSPAEVGLQTLGPDTHLTPTVVVG